MRKILSRIDKLEKSNKSKLIEIENKLLREAERAKSFNFFNQFMEECHPKHGWCSLTLEKRMRIYNKSGPTGTVKITKCGLPVHIPSKKKEDVLFWEANRLWIDALYQELKRRRKLRNGKIIKNQLR